MRGSISAGMPMPSSATRRTTSPEASPARVTSTARRIRLSRSLYFAALFRRFETTCASRVGSPWTRTGSAGSSIESRWPSSSTRDRVVSTARATTSAIAAGSGRSWILPPVTRDTSRRSSTRRTSTASCRWPERERVGAQLGVLLGEAQELERVGQRRQRVPQLVRERREELVLAAVDLAQILLRLEPQPLGLVALEELPDLRAGGVDHLEQLAVGLADPAAEELHDAHDLVPDADREARTRRAGARGRRPARAGSCGRARRRRSRPAGRPPTRVRGGRRRGRRSARA
jgi:hypothetical protein